MIVVDKLLARIITISVCVYGGMLLLTACVQSLKGYETDGNIKELAYLIVGGLLSQVTTRGNKEEPEGTQQVSVPDPLPAPAVVPDTAADAQPVMDGEADPADDVAEADPVAPAGSRASRVRRARDAGHADAGLFLAVLGAILVAAAVTELVSRY